MTLDIVDHSVGGIDLYICVFIYSIRLCRYFISFDQPPTQLLTVSVTQNT